MSDVECHLLSSSFQMKWALLRKGVGDGDTIVRVLQ